jgi:hypothetical protein
MPKSLDQPIGKIGIGTHLRVEENGGLAVNLQDQTTLPLDALFAQEISPFTIAVDTGVSGVSNLLYTVIANPGHGLVDGSEILLIDTAETDQRALFAEVIDVVGDTITIDRPIDHNFLAASTLGRKVLTNMNVDGSVTPQIFSLRAGVIPNDITRLIVSMTDASSMDSSKFGGLPKLERGLVLRLINGSQVTIFNFKTNGEIQRMCYDVSYESRAPAGEFGLSARITFAGQNKHGVALRIQDEDVLQWVVQDDLTGLLTLRMVAQGHQVTD